MASNAKPLALAAAAHGQGKGWRRGADVIDALPYIDVLSEEEKRKVELLIDEETRRSNKKPSDYLGDLPAMPASKFEGHPLLVAEAERVKAKQPMPALDTSRYRLDPPPQTRRNDLTAWQTSQDNAYAQLEHQYNRIQNLELLLKYGDKSWRAQTQLQESTSKALESDLASTRKLVTALNQERKLSQTAAGGELRKLADEYMTLIARNLEIELACDDLETEIATLKQPPQQQQQQAAADRAGAAAAGPAGPAQGAAAVAGQGAAAAGEGNGQGAMEVDGGAGAPAQGNGHMSP